MHAHIDERNELAERRLWDLAPEQATYGRFAHKELL